jgi:hypothetical protein
LGISVYQNINNLPANLKFLTHDGIIDQPIDTLPKMLKQLTLQKGYKFIGDLKMNFPMVEIKELYKKIN